MNLTVKIGGASGIGGTALLDDLASFATGARRTRLTLVHGGSDETTRLQAALGFPAQFLNSPNGQVSRRTERRDLEAFVMATALVNRRLVEGLLARGVRAFGLSGLDGQLAVGARKSAVRCVEGGRVRMLRDQWTGRPEVIDARLLDALFAAGCLPVLAPLLASPSGEMLNTDGDRLAAAVAGALGDETLVILTNVPGLLEDPEREDSLVPHVSINELDAAMGLAKGRMRKKLLGAREALALGVRRVILADARRAAPLTNALLGTGTVLGAPQTAAGSAPRLQGARS